MSGNRSRDTQPELKLRRTLHALGLRYRCDLALTVERRRLRIDIAFTRQRVAVLVDGCFWHGCPAHFRAPRTNSTYWETKIAQNVLRDRATAELLAKSGWEVLRIWEHTPISEATAAVLSALRARNSLS
jgi:DNA mismatch endonuclease, patch repair protein